ncbi:TonB-dependent receptor, plug [Nitrospirillum viridazoti Y2]|uniref:TonB-dependent receptor n=2 Tax=Nitrospirillum TaxID=1543705 RepID=A0A248JTX1_9PROT|nr:TonB-dependent receptor [Nitrospirillum amazonense CBAmc]EGY01926.1 TonB-dependent receptor, plug [Nitrospirillum amazonense Y2]TWB39796.1 iron complex outermembrane receptor protein [Nitrospirillum amazonense]TWB64173.1 iron complex outermembrane receptor protein [Nitrospirillum amazonense]
MSNRAVPITGNDQKKTRAVLTSFLAGGAATLLAGGAPAQTAATATDDSVFQEIVVTARKRAESLTETPTAISAFTAEDLQQRNMENLADVGKYVPNLEINRFGVGNPAHAAIFIRGIGLQDHIITTDPGVGVYVDGVYLGRQMGSNLTLANIERVEVLRGPQGTLYGKNTIGGAVNIITAQPGDEQVTKAELKVGSRARVEANVYTNTKVTDKLAVSFTAAVNRRDGIGQALKVNAPEDVGEINEVSGRAAAKLQASETFSLLLTLDAMNGIYGKTPTTMEVNNPNGFFTGTLGLSESLLPANPDDSNSNHAELFKQTIQNRGASLTANWELNDNLTAKVLGGFRYTRYTGGLDDDQTYLDLESYPERGFARQYSVEPQLNGEYGKLDFVIGAYASDEQGNTNSGPTVYISPSGYFDLKQTTSSYAVYAHAGYKILDDLKLSAGARYSDDHKDASAQFDSWTDPSRVYRSQSWSATTWDVSATYDIAKSVAAYATISRGYQSGGFPPRPFNGPSYFTAFNPTFATNYETGIKGVFFDLLQMNVSGFYTEYTDLPLEVSQPSATGFNTRIESAGQSEAKGFEVEGTLKLSKAFDIQTSVGFIDAQITAVPGDATAIKVGFTPALTPQWTLSVAPQYHLFLDSGTVDARIDYSYRGKEYGQSANDGYNLIKSRSLFGFNIAYTPAQGHWTAAVYGENIFNKRYDVGRLDDAFAGFTEIIRNNDRSEFGLKATYTF